MTLLVDAARLTSRIQGESDLKALKKLEPGPRADELSQFYDLNARLLALNTAIVEGALGHPASAKILAAGRIIILSDGVRCPLLRQYHLTETSPTRSISKATRASCSRMRQLRCCLPAASTLADTFTCSLSCRLPSSQASMVRYLVHRLYRAKVDACDRSTRRSRAAAMAACAVRDTG